MKDFLPEITNKYEEAEKEACLEPSMTCIQIRINHMWAESQLEAICNDMR